MAEIRRIETERLIIESTFIVDKSKELVQAIHEAGEFEWYFGVEETEQRLKDASIRRKWFYNIFDRERNFVGYLGFHQDGDDYGGYWWLRSAEETNNLRVYDVSDLGNYEDYTYVYYAIYGIVPCLCVNNNVIS